jgi:hypothetical protein
MHLHSQAMQMRLGLRCDARPRLRNVRSTIRSRTQERPAPPPLLRLRPTRIQSRATAAPGETATNNPTRATDTRGSFGIGAPDSATDMTWAKTKQPGGTTKGGWGNQHQKLRKQLLAQAYGQPCARCGQPMQPWQELHLDHNDDRTGWIGFSHARCNLRAAAKKARAIQLYGKRVKRTKPVHRW